MTARSFGEVAAHFTEYRNPDRTNVPRRNSFDVEDQRADVWRRICDGSKAQGRAWRAAKLETLREWIHRQWTDGVVGPTEKISPEEAMRREKLKLRRVDRFVLEAMLSFVNYATGELYPAYASIAKKAGVSRATVAESLRRLKFWKMLDWVRRTVTAPTVGEAGPQREQTSNAYHFACEAEMEPRARDYWKRALARNLKRLGGLVAARMAPARPLAPLDPDTQAVFDRMEATLVRGLSASPENGLYLDVGVKDED